MKWEKKTLDELGTVGRGRSKHRPRNDPKLFGGKYPFIQTADVKNANFYIINFSSTYNEEGLAQSKLWPAGTLCITIAANIADTGILAIPACFPDSIIGFVANEEIADTRFVKYCFDVLQKECKQISQGTAQDNLSWEKLSTINFLVPPLQTQKRIASILSAYDDLIENNQKQIKLLEEAAQRLYKEWFVDLRFPGHEGVKIVDGVPEGWSSGQLIKLAEFKRGKTITKSSVKEGNVPVIAGGLEPAYFHNIANTVAPVITVSASGANAGYTALHNHNIWASDCSFIDSRNCEHIYYVYNFLKTNKNMMLNLQKGSAQPHVYAKNINELSLLIPKEKVLKEYSDKVEVIYKAIFHKNKQISSLREARDRLLPKLMSGEIEV